MVIGWLDLTFPMPFYNLCSRKSDTKVMFNVEQAVTAINMTEVRDWMPTWADIRKCTGPMLRSTAVGFFLGLLPGCAPSVTTFVAYDLEKRISKHPEQFGHGLLKGSLLRRGRIMPRRVPGRDRL